MSYVALYRKLRPTKFSQIVGQDQIVTTLKNQVINKRISHAYLFSGTRGTGKTTMAKIFAKVINCENHIDGEPCNSCNSCILINNEQSLNILEIDAASNNGVDSIRDIRDEVKYPPTQGFYKVYIIDEVHMLSIGAFNALLKTLEEPPEHVVFILATTDPQKIPPTILSRCQRFDFKRITVRIMKDTIKDYMLNEDVSITDETLDYISFLSDGSMRDALSILDQCIAFYFNEEITIEKVKIITGSVSTEVFYNLTEGFLTFDSNKCLKIIDEIMIDGRDISQFMSELLVHFRDLLIAKSIDNNETALALSKEQVNKLKEFGKEIPSEILINYINVFSVLQNKLKYSKNPRIDFEIACIQICNPSTEKDNSLLLARIEKLESIIEKGDFVKKKDNNNIEAKKIAPVYKTKAIKEDFEKVKKDYKSIIKKFDGSPLDKGSLANALINYLDNDILYVILTHKIDIDLLAKNKCLDKLKIIFSEKYEKEFNVEFITRSEFDSHSLNLYGQTENSFDNMVDALSEKINYNNIQNI